MREVLGLVYMLQRKGKKPRPDKDSFINKSIPAKKGKQTTSKQLNQFKRKEFREKPPSWQNPKGSYKRSQKISKRSKLVWPSNLHVNLYKTLSTKYECFNSHKISKD